MQPLLVVAHACFHQQPADFVLHLHHLPDQQVAIAQRAPPFANGSRGHVALRQKIAAQAVANLVRVNAIVFLFRRRNGPQHQRMRYPFSAAALSCDCAPPRIRRICSMAYSIRQHPKITNLYSQATVY